MSNPAADEGTTHAESCWAWGPKHYWCALEEIRRLTEEVRDLQDELDASRAGETNGDYPG